MRTRRARPNDLPDLLELEATCFEPERCDSREVFRHSLRSPHQEVWLTEENGMLTGSLFLRFHPHTCRVHSIAVHPARRGTGLGAQLLGWAEKRARMRRSARIHLEADARNTRLLDWYRSHGYRIITHLRDYYSPGWHACRFSKTLATRP